MFRKEYKKYYTVKLSNSFKIALDTCRKSNNWPKFESELFFLLQLQHCLQHKDFRLWVLAVHALYYEGLEYDSTVVDSCVCIQKVTHQEQEFKVLKYLLINLVSS